MPKNRYGGKGAKKMANKYTEDNSHNRFVLPESEDQFIGRITKRCGDGRFLVEYVDENGRAESMARIPGSMRRITRNVRDGCYVLFQRWGISENDNKGSILHLYLDQETVMLRNAGALNGIDGQQDETDSVLLSSSTSAFKQDQDANTEPLDWDAI